MPRSRQKPRKIEEEKKTREKIEISDIKQLEQDLRKAIQDRKYNLAVKYLETAYQYINDMDDVTRKRFAMMSTLAASRIIEYEGTFSLILPEAVKPSKDYLKAAKFYELAADFDKVKVSHLRNAGVCYQLAAVKEKDQYEKAHQLNTAAERFDSAIASIKESKATPVSESSLKQERDLCLMMAAESYVKAAVEFSDLAEKDEKYGAKVNECLLGAANLYAKLNEWEQLANLELSENMPHVYWQGGGKRLADILMEEADEANKAKDTTAVARLYSAVNRLEQRGLLTQADIDQYLKRHKAFSNYTENLQFLEKEWKRIKDKILTGYKSWIEKNSVVIRLAKAYVAEANKKHDPSYYNKALSVLGPFNRRYRRSSDTYITERLYADIQNDVILTVKDFNRVLKKAVKEVTQRDRAMKELERLLV